MSALEKVVMKVDWSLLRTQKLALQQCVCMETDERDGLLHFIDAIQDAAVEDEVATNDQVFGAAGLDFTLLGNEGFLVEKIMRRIALLFPEWDQLSAEMDIVATHRNGCQLDLEKLLNFDDSNFTHDVVGISATLDRTTGKLGQCFSPRCSL